MLEHIPCFLTQLNVAIRTYVHSMLKMGGSLCKVFTLKHREKLVYSIERLQLGHYESFAISIATFGYSVRTTLTELSEEPWVYIDKLNGTGKH